ncbi:MAG: PEP-CTERM sorting domain-containing protein [Terracidiphilus sp.]|jgi:hypothetical protein
MPRHQLKSLLLKIAFACGAIVLAATAMADDFTFSFTNTNPGYTNGTVTGIIYGLTNNSEGPASEIVITSYPPFSCGGGSCDFTNDATSWSLQDSNDFEEMGGVITSAFFQAQDEIIPLPFEPNPPSIDVDLGLNTGSHISDFSLEYQQGIIMQNESLQGPVTFSPYTPPPPPPAPTPEPGTVGLVLSGLTLIAAMMRRQAALR